MLSTDRQTNQRYQKRNLFCQGGKKYVTASGYYNYNKKIHVFTFYIHYFNFLDDLQQASKTLSKLYTP